MRRKYFIPEIQEIKIKEYEWSNSQILNLAKEVINRFIRYFQYKKSPLLFMYEADIQSNLAYKLSEKIRPISFDYNNNNKKEIKEINEMSLINQEYPVKKRFDIACINPQKIEEYIKWKGPCKINFVLWELPILFALEIKYSLYGYTIGYDHIKTDFSKMKDYKEGMYHEERNKELKLGDERFVDDFKFLALNFFQDQHWFKQHVRDLEEKGNPTFQKVKEIDEFNSIYLISFDKILRVKFDEEGQNQR